MIRVQNNLVVLGTESPADEWAYRLRYRLLVLSAAAANPDNGPAIQEAISAELQYVIEMLPDEEQMTQALAKGKA